MASTSFYSQIAANRRNSILLMLAVCGLLGILGFAIGYGVGGSVASAVAVTGMALAFGLLTSAFSYFAGDKLVLTVSGAKAVTEDSAPELMNVVREMTIAANLPMPAVYTIDDTAPNAFATGRDPAHASIAVTTGLLQKLDREELQGVIGHELSHVRNYDIRFSVIVGVLVGSIALLADFFLRFTLWGARGADRRAARGDRSSRSRFS